MSSDHPIEGGLEKTLERMKREGVTVEGLSLSLQIELLSSLGIINERLVEAERQRRDLVKKLEIVTENQNQVYTNTQLLKDMQESLAKVINAEAKNTEFRQRFEGGSIVAKVIWIVFGGVLLWAFQKLLERVH